ncbi:hypothetical protein H920_07904 [Fukomys damarensis]|uniref:Uncharacterized protein n=1 Tax=Fukomys damarensis TaxID=885580 RepID=A0A091DEV6_FUKDA|nr:hypothetical protein H920_07904 [Fukomys damarensis]
MAVLQRATPSPPRTPSETLNFSFLATSGPHQKHSDQGPSFLSYPDDLGPSQQPEGLKSIVHSLPRCHEPFLFSDTTIERGMDHCLENGIDGKMTLK